MRLTSGDNVDAQDWVSADFFIAVGAGMAFILSTDYSCGCLIADLFALAAGQTNRPIGIRQHVILIYGLSVQKSLQRVYRNLFDRTSRKLRVSAILPGRACINQIGQVGDVRQAEFASQAWARDTVKRFAAQIMHFHVCFWFESSHVL